MRPPLFDRTCGYLAPFRDKSKANKKKKLEPPPKRAAAAAATTTYSISSQSIKVMGIVIAVIVVVAVVVQRNIVYAPLRDRKKRSHGVGCPGCVLLLFLNVKVEQGDPARLGKGNSELESQQQGRK